MQRKIKINLSIIIVSYNVKKLLLQCISTLIQNIEDLNYEIIIVDNGSTDGSLQMMRKIQPQSGLFNPNIKFQIISNDKNLGYAKANNQGIKISKGEYILILNPDTIIYPNAIQKVLEYLENNPKVGAATCRVELPDGKLDYSCHRGFPTPWSSFCYFLGLSKLLPKSKLFSTYTATYLDINSIHEIDALTGAFAFVRKKAGDEIDWFDEDYFWNGEDIDFCYKLKERGWKIVFIPSVKITHFKGSSSGLWHTAAGQPSKESKTRSALSSTQVMRLFYQKHLSQKYPFFINGVVYFGIFILERLRFARHNIS